MKRRELTDDLARVMLDSTPDGVLLCDDTGKITYANDQLLALSGYTDEELIGLVVEELVPTSVAEDHVSLRRNFETNASRSMAPSRKIRMRCKDGSELSVAVALTTYVEDGRRSVVASIRDISELMEREHRLTASNEALALASERERIARDLHDNVLQHLFGLGLELQAIEAVVGDALAKRLATGVDQIDRAIREIRTTVFTLGSSARTGTFGQELQTLASQAARLLGFPPRIVIDGAADLLIPTQVQLELLAVLREALGNVARHAHATEAIVELTVGPELVAVVDDNGVGIPKAALYAGNGLGNLAARARGLGGSFTVAAKPAGGTRLTWSVPL